MFEKIAVLCSGGDAPGMNACIRSVVRCGIYSGLQVFGVMRGYEGLMEGHIKEMSLRSVSNIIARGGTILKTARSQRFMADEGKDEAMVVLNEKGIDGLIVIGGNGSFKGAHTLQKKWGRSVVGVPGTIDNDLTGTDFSIGADTAVNTALDAMDKIRDTVHSMERTFVVEVMGREEGFIAIMAGLAGGAEDVLVPQAEFNIEDMCDDIRRGREKGKFSWIVVVSEGVAPAEEVAKSIAENTGFEVRSIRLGHIQRGGSPTAFDRILASRLGAAAVEALIGGESDIMVGVEANDIKKTPLPEACKHSQKKLALDRELYRLTRVLAT